MTEVPKSMEGPKTPVQSFSSSEISATHACNAYHGVTRLHF